MHLGLWSYRAPPLVAPACSREEISGSCRLISYPSVPFEPLKVISHTSRFCIAVAAVIGLTSPRVVAAPDEIQVYTEELDDPGEFGLELHVNFVPKGTKTPSYSGEVPPHHVLQVTPEFSYGISRTLEAGLYLPFAYAPGGSLYQNGARLRLKYIAPRAEEQAFFWGLNVEYGYFSQRVSESRQALEMRPIIGYRATDWMVSFNPIVDVDLSHSVSRKPTFDPALKVGQRVSEGAWLGFEYYGEYGPLSKPLPTDERSHYVYAVADVALKGFDLNIGIGRGFVAAPDDWVVKAIVGFPFK